LNTWGITLKTFEFRKVGHLVLYGFVSVMIVRVIVSGLHWHPIRASALTLAIVSVLALADELQQTLRVNRNGTVADVQFDIAAAGLTLLAYWCLLWLRAPKRGSSAPAFEALPARDHKGAPDQ
jgi:VanZ family protein